VNSSSADAKESLSLLHIQSGGLREALAPQNIQSGEAPLLSLESNRHAQEISTSTSLPSEHSLLHSFSSPSISSSDISPPLSRAKLVSQSPAKLMALRQQVIFIKRL
jgi:hypothetical protein